MLTLNRRRICFGTSSMRARACLCYAATDIWSRLPHKTKLLIHSCSPDPGKMYAHKLTAPTAIQTDDCR